MTTRVHQNWETLAFELAPTAPNTGPFVSRDFLQTINQHRRQPNQQLVLAETETSLLPLHVQTDQHQSQISFVGEADLTDYHSPFGLDLTEPIAHLCSRYPQARWDLDSLPEEAVSPLQTALEKAGKNTRCDPQTVAAVIALPTTFADYQNILNKKQRHEIRRKQRRYLQELGPIQHLTHDQPDWGFDEFVSQHQQAEGEKGSFFTTEMRDFFADLLSLEGWRLDFLQVGDGQRIAAAMLGFVDDSGYYLYNSSYDPELGAISPGWVLLAALIEQTIQARGIIFDFLKGDERYKFRFGASSRQLYRLQTD